MIFTISNQELQKLNDNEVYNFPKYTSQIINWANQNAQGTRPKVVGQLSELFPEFESETDNISIDRWKEWYLKKYPYAIEDAADKIYVQVENLRDTIIKINREMVCAWVEDLVITKTYNGLYVQKAILAKLGELKTEEYRLATPDEESKGIDGYVGGIAYSIKPDTYKAMCRLTEEINAKMIYYNKTKSALRIEVED